MSRPIFEPSPERWSSSLQFGVDQLFRRPAPDPLPVVLFIKVFSDTQALSTGDQKFQFEISEDMDGMDLVRVEGYVTTVSSSGTVTVQLAKLGSDGAAAAVDMLSTRLTIDVSERNSRQAAVPVVINTAQDDVAWGDHLRIDVDVAGTGAMGLGVMLTFALPETFTL
jgi:hypothetical protein